MDTFMDRCSKERLVLENHSWCWLVVKPSTITGRIQNWGNLVVSLGFVTGTYSAVGVVGLSGIFEVTVAGN
jgi:hypothetical protein